MGHLRDIGSDRICLFHYGRGRLAGLTGDKIWAMPILCGMGKEALKAKEAIITHDKVLQSAFKNTEALARQAKGGKRLNSLPWQPNYL